MTSPLTLGRLEKVDLRQVWANEAGDFTPWLARPENITLLGDAIGLDLEVEAQEKFVGPFRADILCKDTASDDWVLIENQLERTNHGHLGQLLTYASGLKAVTIVWIAQRFTDEHRAVLDWLNKITSEDFNFFGLEVELWRIGNSAVAPKFNVVSQPNDWTRSVTGATTGITDGALTETKQLQLQYWTKFRDLLEERKSPIRTTKPHPQHWYDVSVGRSGFHLSAIANTRDEVVSVGLICGGPYAKEHFRMLYEQRAAVETALGVTPEWLEKPEKKTSEIIFRRHGADPANQADWPEQQKWLADTLERFHTVFSPRVKVLDATGHELDAAEPEAEEAGA